MAVNVPEGIILIWKGTHAGIPAGWVRETALDGVFPKGTADGIDPGVAVGSDTHTHTSPAHSHNPLPHRHFGQTTRDGAYESDSGAGGPKFDCARDQHLHDFDFTNVSGGVLTDAVTYAAGDSKPPFYEVIFIKPDAAPAEPPDDVISLFARIDIPVGWNICDGNNGTPNLVDKYLRGAGTGADAGTTGGSLNHDHAIDHTHSSVNHYHDGMSGGDSDQGNRYSNTNTNPGGQCAPHHSHTVHLDNVAETGDAYTGRAGIADSVEPRHRKLFAIQNNVGAADRPRYLVALWLGLLHDIPAGWKLMDGVNGAIDMRGYHLKITSNTVLLGDVAGSNTHSHAPSNSHTHLAAGSHTHTGSTSYQPVQFQTNNNPEGASKDHSHTVASCSYATSTWDVALVQADAANGEPSSVTVAFIEFTGVPIAEDRTAEITGQGAGVAERGAELFAVNPGEERFGEITGKRSTSSERGAEIAGKIQWTRVPKPTLEYNSA